MFHVTTEHQGRELMHAVALLALCLQIPGVSPVTRRRWEQEMQKARGDLDLLYAGGLRRDFLRRDPAKHCRT